MTPLSNTPEIPRSVLQDRLIESLLENESLRARVKELEKQVADLCPIGDLPALETWQAEKSAYMEQIADLEQAIRSAILALTPRGDINITRALKILYKTV